MSADNQPVIVIKKGGHGRHGHHGGAWKVAYADFVTAMMAFFLVMWIVGQSKSTKEAVAGYFRDPVAFEAKFVASPRHAFGRRTSRWRRRTGAFPS